MTETWSQILKRVRTRQQEIKKDGSVAWFRGHRRDEWKLKSTLHRYVENEASELGLARNHKDDKALLREEGKTIYSRFAQDAWHLLEVQERTDWGVLFAMQHYGLPTRLLDWSESFMCALFFAQESRNSDEDAAVFILDPQRLNDRAVGQEGLIRLDEGNPPGQVNALHWHPKVKPPDGDLSTIAVAPLYTNPRMLAQRSGFTISGDSFEPLEDQAAAKGNIEKLLLPKEAFGDVEEYFELSGVDAFNYFPDREGLRMKHEAKAKRSIADAKRFYFRGSSS